MEKEKQSLFSLPLFIHISTVQLWPTCAFVQKTECSAFTLQNLCSFEYLTETGINRSLGLSKLLCTTSLQRGLYKKDQWEEEKALQTPLQGIFKSKNTIILKDARQIIIKPPSNIQVGLRESKSSHKEQNPSQEQYPALITSTFETCPTAVWPFSIVI